jgi:uncharacterized membrane protein
MNATVLIAIPATLVVVAAIMLVLPAMMPHTLPLGVSVPVERQDESVIRAAQRRYRVLIAVAWLVAILVFLVLTAVSPVAASLVGVLVFVAGSALAYILARQGIVRAKHDGKWYRDVPVRLVGSVTVDPVHIPVPTGWFAASLLLLAVAAATGIGVYDALPHRIPTHWGIGGLPDRYAGKDVWSVFGPLIIGAMVAVVLFALSFVNRVAPVRSVPGASAEENALRARAIRTALSRLVGHLMFVIALAVSWLAVTAWLMPDARWAVAVGTIGLLVLIALVLVAFLWRWWRLVGGGAPRRESGHVTANAPDDDRFWKAGIFYVNRDDPAIVVQRRFGVGWTLNLGHPAGVAVGVVVLALIIGTVVLVSVLRAAR